MKKCLLISLILINFSILFAHAGQVKHSIIIDTDCAADDLRAICMILASTQIKTVAITTSDGALSPEEGAIKVRVLLNSLNHEGIPVGHGQITQSIAPVWRVLSQNIIWGDAKKETLEDRIPAPELIKNSLSYNEEPITIVCLGSLTNIAQAVKNNPEIKNKIKRIVWYNNHIHPNIGTNYEIDKLAAEYILESGLTIDVVTPNDHEINFSEELLQVIESVPTQYAQKIVETHHQPAAYQMIKNNHFKLWDDFVPIYLLHPENFISDKLEEYPSHSINHLKAEVDLERELIEILSDKLNEQGVVFKTFPITSEYFRKDVQPYVDQIIARHGDQEWKIIVMTNEFHDHLGIYSIVGAKMGLRAREYFNVGRDEMSVVSFTGSNPPISCLNDGLQVSTGATLGQGTITIISEDLSHQPKAIFNYRNKAISIELKKEYWETVRNDIKQCIAENGALTDTYWQAVRELAIKYWLKWDRNKIFNIEMIRK